MRSIILEILKDKDAPIELKIIVSVFLPMSIIVVMYAFYMLFNAGV